MDESLKRGRDVAYEGGRASSLRRAVAVVRHAVSARWAETLCACLLILLAANYLTAISRKNINNDEIVHIPAGYYHLVAGEFYMNVEHPPLVKMWAALPLLFIQPDEPKSADADAQDFMVRALTTQARFWEANRARFEEIAYWPRVMMIPLALALGALIFIHARRLFGARAALFAVALFSLEPTILAHGRVVHTDVPAALAYLLFFIALHAHLSAPSVSRALRLGAATGLALVTKFSLIVVAPVFALWALYYALRPPRSEGGQRAQARRTGRGIQVASALLIALFVVNAAYYFRRPPIQPADARWVSLVSPRHTEVTLSAIAALSKFVPTPYLFGLYSILMQNYDGRDTSLLGAHGVEGSWAYFPVAFALKTTLPFLLLATASLVWACRQFYSTRERRWLIVLAPLALFALACMRSNINIGIRHFLPAYPFLFIMGGALLDRLTRMRPRVAPALLVVALLGWMSVEAARSYPDYVPYMNQLAANHPHWWYLSDSNVEWGDDVGELAEYLKARGERRVSAALAGGWSTLGYYGVEYVDLFSRGADAPFPTRYVAVGASFLNGSTVPPGPPGSGRETRERRVNFFDSYRDRKPEAIFGGSIYLYRVGE